MCNVKLYIWLKKCQRFVVNLCLIRSDKPEDKIIMKRLFNIIIFFACIILLFVLPIRNLLFTEIPNNSRGDGFRVTSYIMLGFFGLTSIIFGSRVLRFKRCSK